MHHRWWSLYVIFLFSQYKRWFDASFLFLFRTTYPSSVLHSLTQFPSEVLLSTPPPTVLVSFVGLTKFPSSIHHTTDSFQSIRRVDILFCLFRGRLFLLIILLLLLLLMIMMMPMMMRRKIWSDCWVAFGSILLLLLLLLCFSSQVKSSQVFGQVFPSCPLSIHSKS